jgi:hypothetical protein
MRTATVLLSAVLGLLGATPAAYAKGPTAATLEGPGLATPVRIEAYDATAKLPGLGTLMQWTGGTVLFGDGVRLAPDRPAGDLGPRFAVTYFMDRQPVLVQELYPFAASGPHTFTLAGQRSVFTDGELPGGWFRCPGEIVASLALLGIAAPVASATAAGPQAAPGQPAVPATPDAPAGPAARPADHAVPLGWWLTGVLAAVVLAGAAVAFRVRTGRTRRIVGVRR